MSFFQKEERQKWLLFTVWCDSLISQSKRRIEQKTFAANQQKSIHFIQLQNQRLNLIDYPQYKTLSKKRYCFYPPETGGQSMKKTGIIFNGLKVRQKQRQICEEPEENAIREENAYEVKEKEVCLAFS